MLPFCPLILETQDSKMREICDKHFPDNWVISIYGGELVDVLQYWGGFVAANKALNNNIVLDRVKYFAIMNEEQIAKCEKKIKKFIVEG